MTTMTTILGAGGPEPLDVDLLELTDSEAKDWAVSVARGFVRGADLFGVRISRWGQPDIAPFAKAILSVWLSQTDRTSRF